MQQRPELTDRTALFRARARSTAQGMFLHEEAKFEVQERLADINRTFSDAALVTGFPDTWRPVLPDAVVVPDDEILQLEPGAHDLVVHAMGLHWANDPVGQIIQGRRALRPDGLFLGVGFGGRTLHELRTVLAQAESDVTGGLSPRVAPMAETRDLGSLLQRAGMALPVTDTVPLPVTYASLFHLMRDLRAMGETNALNERDRRIPPRALFSRAADLYAEMFPAPDNRIHATFELIFVSGWVPHESQQKPARPGSATTRLADALGTEEQPARDTVPPRRD